AWRRASTHRAAPTPATDRRRTHAPARPRSPRSRRWSSCGSRDAPATKSRTCVPSCKYGDVTEPDESTRDTPVGELRRDALTGEWVNIVGHRQARPNLPADSCPFCVGGLEAPEPYVVRWFPNRWPALAPGTPIEFADGIAAHPAAG